MESVALKRTVLELLDDVESIFNEPEEMVALMAIKKKYVLMNEKVLSDSLVESILPRKRDISSRNKIFFREFLCLMPEIPENYKEYMRDMLETWVEKRISEEEMDILWQYFDAIVELCEVYKKRN